uniref:Uncharacterized protein n=1 Tax=Manihot esculenta TaxID=3983 RepID=A0A2C9V7F3_MANES
MKVLHLFQPIPFGDEASSSLDLVFCLTIVCTPSFLAPWASVSRYIASMATTVDVLGSHRKVFMMVVVF